MFDSGSVVFYQLNSNFAPCVRKGRKEGSSQRSAAGLVEGSGVVFFIIVVYYSARFHLLILAKG